MNRCALLIYIRLVALVAGLEIGSSALRASIIYDANSDSNSSNITDPGMMTLTGFSLWDYVAQVRGGDGVSPDASAVYLGNGYLLTANHVTGSRYFIQGVECAVDPTFGVLGSRTVTDASNAALDLKVIKLASAPALPSLKMADATDATTGQFSLFIGWGVGKSSSVAGQGWLWGNSSTVAQRWGSNSSAATTFTESGNPNTYLYSFFDRTQFADPADNAEVFGLSLGDSGGGLFQYHNGDWELAGIGDAVEVFGSTFYDRDLTKPGDQSDASFFIDLQVHSADVLNSVPEIAIIPETSSLGLALLGGGLLLGLQWRTRRV